MEIICIPVGFVILSWDHFFSYSWWCILEASAIMGVTL